MKNENGVPIQLISMEDMADAIAEIIHKRSFREVVTFQEMVDYAMAEKEKNTKIAAFIVSVKKNYDPQNENDKFVVVQGFLDACKNPLTMDGKEAESRIIHTKTIDKRFVDILDGAETRIIKL